MEVAADVQVLPMHDHRANPAVGTRPERGPADAVPPRDMVDRDVASRFDLPAHVQLVLVVRHGEAPELSVRAVEPSPFEGGPDIAFPPRDSLGAGEVGTQEVSGGVDSSLERGEIEHRGR